MWERIVGAWNRRLVRWYRTAPGTAQRDPCTASVRRTGSSNLRRTTSLFPWVGRGNVVKLRP